MAAAINILFICTVNRMRSRTAETIWSADPRYNVRSAGIAPDAETQVTAEMLLWADRIFVMENYHKAFILNRFPDSNSEARITVLGIPDMFYYMEPELIELLRKKLEPHLGEV